MAYRKLTIEDIQTFAKERGGRCLSESYSTGTRQLEWECAKGHRWRNSYRNMRCHKSWCPVCGKRAKLGIEDMRTLARELGGRCLSDVYANAMQPLEWQCRKGHKFTKTYRNIRANGSWCPVCAREARRGKKG